MNDKLKKILTDNREAWLAYAVDEEELSESLYDALYEYFCVAGEMPYGVAKARTGDPYCWIGERMDKYIDFRP